MNYLGIIRNDEFLLSTVQAHAPWSQRQAECWLRDWQMVYPTDKLRIEPLSKRDKDGWEIRQAKKRRVLSDEDHEAYGAMIHRGLHETA